MAQYKSYTHLERIDKSDCEGLLDGPCSVTAKVDATNAVVYWGDGAVQAGSRKRALTEDADNGGFRNWVTTSDDAEAAALRKFIEDYPTLMVYGEWMGSGKFLGAIKDYNPEALGHMYIFDVYDTDLGAYWTENSWRDLLAEYGLEPWFVELFGIYDDLTPERLLEIAQNNKFLLNNANHPGEGVTVKRQDDWTNPWGHTVYGKLVLDEYKQDKSKSKKVKVEPDNIENTIVERYVTDSELSKTLAKIALIMDVDNPMEGNNKKQCIGRMISTMWRELLEETPNWAKEFHNPTVDFGKLQRLCNAKVRNYLGL